MAPGRSIPLCFPRLTSFLLLRGYKVKRSRLLFLRCLGLGRCGCSVCSEWERELHNATSVGEADWIATRNGALRFGSHVSCWLAQGDTEQKRVILSALGSNLAIRDQMVAITLENPLLLGLERTVTEIPETGASFGGFEPRKSGSFSGLNGCLVKRIPTLLPG